MSQQQVPAARPQKTEWEPSKNTVWVVEDRVGMIPKARDYLVQKYSSLEGRGQMVQYLPVDRLSPTHEIVVLYVETERKVVEKKVKASRAILQSQPIKCAELFPEGAVQDDMTMSLGSIEGGVQVQNLRDEVTGRLKPGLCDLIMRACMRKNEFGKMVPTVRAVFRPDSRQLRVTRDS